MKQLDKWHMTDDEIRRSWRRAADRRAQIGILAQLNNRTKDAVIQKLQDLGEDVEFIGKKLRCKLDKEDDRKIWRLRMDGMPYYKIVLFLSDKPTEHTVKNRFEKLREDYKNALPVVRKALQTFVEAVPTENEEVIKSFIRRFL